MSHSEKLNQVRARIRYLRESLDISAADLAKNLKMTVEEYLRYELEELDIPVSMIYSLAGLLNVDPTELLTGEAPRMISYAVTRSGQGAAIERFDGYSFESLAANYIGRDKEPMMVSILPTNERPSLVSHGGQEFNYCIEGKIGVIIGDKDVILNTGDSIYFNPNIKHGQYAIGGKAKFLTVIDKE